MTPQPKPPVRGPKPKRPLPRPKQRIARGPIARKARKPGERKKKPLFSRLRDRLDVLFSRYVKERDGAEACITCGKAMLPVNLNAGHFISRTRMSVRWDPKNAHSQCARPCNYHRRGAPAEYALAILDRYGVDEYRRLMARKLIDKKWTTPELLALIAAIERSPAEFEALYYEENF